MRGINMTAPEPTLTLDEVRQLIRDTTPVVVKPGESLVIRKADLTPDQQREYQQALDYWHQDGKLPFRVFVFVGDELGKVEAPDLPFGLPEHCCVCGSHKVVYHNYQEKPFCRACADGEQPERM